MLNRFIVAWQFLTIIPLSRTYNWNSPEALAQSMMWFPLVGLLIGTILAGAMAMLDHLVARAVGDGLLLLMLVLLTRGLHVDGLADTIDGWVGGQTPERRLAIMRDPHIGTFGVMAVVLGLGLRYLGLSALPDTGRWIAVISMPLIGRWAMVAGALGMTYARAEGGLAQPFVAHVTKIHVLVATLCAAVWLAWVFGTIGAVTMLALSALVARAGAFISQRLCGGITGDVFGLINEVSEVAFLLAAPLLLSRR